MRRLSGVQKEVLSLYRKILREAFLKDRNQQDFSATFGTVLFSKGSTTHFAREEFRRQEKTVKRSNFKAVEQMIRKGEKQLKMLRMPGVRVVKGVH